MLKKLALFLSVLCITTMVCAQDDADPDNLVLIGADEQSSNFNITVGGDLNAGGTIFFNDFKHFADTRATSLIFGSLHVHAVAPVTEAYFGVKINDMTFPIALFGKPELYPHKPQIPRWIDEGYMQATIGPVTFGGGLKKMTWGKADAFSVLDIINSQDLSDPTVSDPLQLKLARPMFYISAYLPLEMKFEAVYLPVFEGSHFAVTGRWAPKQAAGFGKAIVEDITKDPVLISDPAIQALLPMMGSFDPASLSATMPPDIDSAKLKYSQTGLRYTVTINGYHDIGFQYYYGFLPTPALQFSRTGFSLMAHSPNPAAMIDKAFSMDYNPYHQIGMDYAFAFGVVNVRAELAANITDDLAGDKPNIYNPNIAWNFGIDYTSPVGLSFNICAAENIKLKYKNIGTNLYDIEKGAKRTSTKIMLLLSQPLLRDSINIKLRTIMACETVDFMMVPSVDWTFGTLFVDAEAGFFFGKKDGLFSQYKDNNYLKLSIGYTF